MDERKEKCLCCSIDKIKKSNDNFICHCKCHSSNSFGSYNFKKDLLGTIMCTNSDNNVFLDNKITLHKHNIINYDSKDTYLNQIETFSDNLEMKKIWHNMNEQYKSVEISNSNIDTYYNPNLNFLYNNLSKTSLTFDDYIFNLKNRLISKHIHAGTTFHEYYNTIDGTLFFCGNINCLKKYTTKNGIIYHVESGCKNKKTWYKFFCPYAACNKRFKTRNGFKYHIESKHYN